MSLYTFPSNKLEYLVQVLSKLLENQDKDIFTPTQLIVGSRGMQHWLSMQLANYSKANITMNNKYDMVNGFILNICYEITGLEQHKKDYVRETLLWRIYKLLDDVGSEKLKEYYEESLLKKYQLSAKIAEVFSAYLSYRVDWLEAWENGKYIKDVDMRVNEPQEDEQWQSQLWRLLVAEMPNTPYKVQKQAIQKLNKSALQNIGVPNDIFIFGVNTISPKNLDFIFKLAEHVDINLLYVNPCSEYWGDLKTKKISAWLDDNDDEIQPLLANLGQQGKEFINELIKSETKQEYEIFEVANKLENIKQTQLVSVQRDLLELNCNNSSAGFDNSISINSCHSPLREVQVLHDKLLDIIKNDSSIKPRDMLVMCPNIEDYVPYVDSVFSRYPKDGEAKLPCSIADRTLLDSEPLAASFIDLLQLPESNFEVNKILDYLEVPAIQKKFEISQDQLETIRYWLKEACIHHSNNDKTFSWSWGLKRLMLGFGYSDTGEIIDDKLLTVPIIEGSEINDLGGLYELLELLAEYTQELCENRTVDDWQKYLLEMFDDVFETTSDEQYIAAKIKQIISKTVESAKDIIKDEKIDLFTIRYCLISQLSEPIINNHFLNGKVTFCSMTPMRSVPFKVVAMLGLNNGKFPRRDVPISFDLMARLGRRVGDRTKRDDDRYLFLESILSAREYLYLSYVGKSIKTNKKQESSLILKEFIEYLVKNYNWKEDSIKEYPLHAFSEKCYSDGYNSYDNSWLELIKKESKSFCDTDQSLSAKLPEYISIPKLVNIFDNPLKAYSNYTLELRLEDYFDKLEDSEPFDIDNLKKHDLKQKLFADLAKGNDTATTLRLSQLSGKLPESVITEDEIETELVTIKSLVDESNINEYDRKHYRENILGYELEASCYIKGGEVLLVKTSKLKIKYKLELYLTLLLVAYHEQKDVSGKIYFVENNNVINKELFVVDYKRAKSQLEHYVREAEKLISQATLAHLLLAEALYGEVKLEDQKQSDWNSAISDEYTSGTLDEDEYFNLYYSTYPMINDFEGESIYQEFFGNLDLNSG